MALGPKKDGSDGGWRGAGLALTIPSILAACVLVGVLLGELLDRWLGTGPILLLVGLVIGSVAGVRETIRIVRKMNSTRE